MNLRKLKNYCYELKSKGHYSIDPKDIRLSQRITALLVPEFIEILQNIENLNTWDYGDCLYLQGLESSRNICKCTLCIIKAQVRHMVD